MANNWEALCQRAAAQGMTIAQYIWSLDRKPEAAQKVKPNSIIRMTLAEYEEEQRDKESKP